MRDEVWCHKIKGLVVDEAHCVKKWYDNHNNPCTMCIITYSNRRGTIIGSCTWNTAGKFGGGARPTFSWRSQVIT